MIEVKDSRFIRNIAYIQQILISEHDISRRFYDMSDPAMQAAFQGSDPGNQVQMKVCVDNAWTSRYFFQEVIDPDETYDDSVTVNNIETVSPFYIRGNAGAIVFADNMFSENIGTTGGAIHIEDPDFRYAVNNTNKNPYIVMKNN